MSSDINLKSIKPALHKLLKFETRHAVFLVIMLILAVYLLTVWRIGKLATAEPSIEDQTKADSAGRLLRVDEDAIRQIQDLEQRNASVQSLFNEARKNPFRE